MSPKAIHRPRSIFAWSTSRRPRSRGRILTTILATAVAVGLPTPGAAQQIDYTLERLLASVGARTTSLARSGRAIQVIDREQIRATPAKTVIDLLRWVNGVDLRDRSPVQADISLRGAGFEEVLVLVNGVRRSDAQTGHFDLDLTIPIDRIDRIEVLRGPASALYGGDAVGGVINVITRNDPGSSWGGRIEGGSFGSGAGSLNGSTAAGLWSLQGGAEFSRSDGDRDGSDFEGLVVDGSAARQLWDGRLVLEGGYARRDFGAEGFYAPIPAYEETRTTNGALRWAGALTPDIGLQTLVTARRHEDRFVFFRDEPERGANTHDAHELGLESVARWSADGPVALAAGGEIYEEALESSNLGDRSQTRAALFAEASFTAGGGRAAVSFGLRGDFHDAYSSFVSPSAAASFQATDQLTLRASVDRSFRPPTWTERFYADPFHQASEEIDPERAWSTELGLDLDPGGDWTTSVSFFRRSAEDLIDWAKPGPSIPELKWETRNVEEAVFRGVELDFSAEDLLGARWSLGLSALDLDAEEEAGFFSKSALRPERRRATVGVLRSFGRLHLGLQGLVAERVREDGYGRLDLRTAIDLPTGQLYMDLTNLTDEDHLDIAGQIVPGTALVIGFRVDPSR